MTSWTGALSQWIGRERSLNVFHLPINWLHTNENPVRSSFLISNVLCAEDIVPSESCEETSDLVSKAQFFYKYDWLNWLRFESWVSWDNIHCCMTFWHNKANSHNDNDFYLKWSWLKKVVICEFLQFNQKVTQL